MYFTHYWHIGHSLVVFVASLLCISGHWYIARAWVRGHVESADCVKYWLRMRECV